MNDSTVGRALPTMIGPGEERVVVEGDGATPEWPSLAIVATQPESPDDGGSQSALGILTVRAAPAVKVEFDVRDGVVLNIPAARFTVAVRNLNGDGDPSLKASAFYVAGQASSENTRTYDIGFGMENPNIRVPAFATAFVFDHGLANQPGYQALLSDSATGETYGLTSPSVRCALNHRTRYVRFMNLPPGAMGTITFFLAI